MLGERPDPLAACRLEPAQLAVSVEFSYSIPDPDSKSSWWKKLSMISTLKIRNKEYSLFKYSAPAKLNKILLNFVSCPAALPFRIIL